MNELKKHVIWAVDPYCEDCSLIKQTAKAVRLLATQWNVPVEPVYLVPGFPPNVKPLPTLLRDIESQAETELNRVTRGVHIPRRLPLRAIGSTTEQIREKTDRLIDYAKRTGAALIAIGTRSRKGPARWFMGSFAESLTLRSDVPLFVINPKEMTPRRLNRILFPTDFSEQSRAAFEKVVQFSKETGAHLTVFHKIMSGSIPLMGVELWAHPEYQDLYQLEVEGREQDAESWAKRALQVGVDAEWLVDSRMIGSPADSILRASQGNAGMIAMSAQSGPLSAAFLGSTTRHVIRSARCPVWVVHTERKRPATFSVTEEDVMSDLTEHGRPKRQA